MSEASQGAGLAVLAPAGRLAPRRPPAAAEPAPPGWGGFHAADLLVTAALRWRALLLAALVPALLGLGFALLASPRYAAEMVLLVQPTREAVGGTDVTGFGPNIVSIEILKVARAEQEILTSAEVLRDALERAGPGAILRERNATPGEGLDRAVRELGRALRVETEPGSNLLRVTLTLPDRARAVRGLEAVMAAYFDRRNALFTDEAYRLLLAEIDQVNTRLRDVDARIRQVRAEAGVLDLTQDIPLAAGRRQELLNREQQVRESRAANAAQLAAAERAQQSEPSRVFAFQDATNLRPNDESRNQLARLLQERARMAAQYAADWPALRELDRQIASLRQVIATEGRQALATTREVRNPNQELLAGRVLSLRLEGEALAGQARELERQRQEVEARGTALLAAEQRLRELGREREGLETILRQLATREAGARIGEEARRQGRPGVQVIQPPVAPLEGSSIRRIIALGGAVAGVALAGLLALVLTLTRGTAATPEEAARHLRLPALARFRHLRPYGVDLTPSEEVENLMSLLRDTRVDGRRPSVVQVLGTTPQDGRAELARALAVALAQREAGGVALVDLQGDGREHLLALGTPAVKGERGAAGELLMLATVLPRLFIAFEAARTDLADPRAGIEQVEALVRRLRASFETVILVAPDGADSYAARRLAAVVDANILVVRGERTKLREARAVRDAVLASGGALLGLAYTNHRPVLPRALADLA